MLLLIVGCGLPPEALVDDADDDGWTAAAGDCDDNDALVSPEAAEVCDGRDNDCEGTVDRDACRSWEVDNDEGVGVLGEEGLGETLAVGHFDGDTRPDVVAFATLGAAEAVCLLPGARLDGSPEQALAAAGTCWIAPPAPYPPVAVSAARYGQASVPGQEVVFVGGRESVCLLDPYGEGYTLDVAAQACVTAADLTETEERPSGYAAADHAAGTIAVWNALGVVVVDPVYYLDGGRGAAGWAVEADDRLRAVTGGRDLTGDGVADLLLASASTVWVVPADAEVNAPVALVGEAIPMTTSASAVGWAGDLDGDGLDGWWLYTPGTVEVYSFDTLVTRIAGPDRPPAPVGDFNGDAVDDLFLHFDDGGTAGVAGLLGGAWPLDLYARTDADLVTFAEAGEFGKGIAAAGDAGDDGLADPWFVAPSYAVDGVVRGKLYRIDGWPIDASIGEP